MFHGLKETNAVPSQSPATSARQRRLVERERPIASSLGLPHEHVRLIDQSHERCAALGLTRIERPDFTPLGRSDLSIVRERNLRLHRHAAPVMEMLYEQIVNTGSLVVLTDGAGVVLHSIGDDDFLERAAKVALAPGANWSESAKGTNAVGTALVSESPTLVHADEHYLHANHFLTCSAAPIFDSRGNMLGVLDVSGDHRSYHQHTMALVKMSARMIENQWLSEHCRHAMRLHFHSRMGVIGTLMEGILAVSTEGRILGANRSAVDQLGLDDSNLRMHSVMSLFGVGVGALVDHFRTSLATPLHVRSADGRAFHVHGRFNWPVWSQVTDAAAAAVAATVMRRPVPASVSEQGPNGAAPAAVWAPTVPAEPVEQRLSLDRMRTGDAQVDAVVGKLERVLDRDIPVLLLGETGTGKEWMARALHASSARAHRAFVAMDCAALADHPLNAEVAALQGTVDGATGVHPMWSCLLQANGGTLFLDGIGSLPLPVQAQLLRVLKERRLTLPGAPLAESLDVTLISASHQALRDLMDAGTLREDLYYFANGLAVHLPPLRQRSDLVALVRRILDAELCLPHLGLSQDVQSMMQASPWPGNLRQLFNVLRAAAAMAGTERWIRAEHLPEDFVDEWRAHTSARGIRPADSALPVATGEAETSFDAPSDTEVSATQRSLDEVEREAIERAVAEAGGNISVAAKRLGVSRNTIYRRLRWNARSSA